MSFFRELHNDLRTAAEDLRTNGLNLDSLREEIGNEKRDPLPLPPPLKRASKSDAASSHASKPAAVTPPLQPPPEISSKPPASQQKKVAVAPSSEASAETEPGAKTDDKKKRAPQELSAAAPSPPPSLVGGLLTTAQTSGRELLTTAQTTTRRLAAQTNPDTAKLQRDLERTQQRYERCKAGLYRFEASAANGYAEYARAAEELRSMVSRSAGERVELERLRSMARRDAELAERAVLERDASTAELEAVALRQVDALQAEVASLRREKRRAEALERSLEKARAELEKERRAEATTTTSSNGTSELRSLRIQLASARSGASAAARASRAAVDAANERAEASLAQVADARSEIAQLRTALAKSHQDLVEALKAPASASTPASGPRDRRSRNGTRSDEADELRALLRQAVEEKGELRERLEASKRDIDFLSELKSTGEKKAESDISGLKGELTAARRALREARQAIVEGRRDFVATDVADEPTLGAKQSSVDDADDNHSTTSSMSSMAPNASGAYEYLRTVVKTALPATPSTSATRARLVPVLRSLLSLPQETVVSSLEALTRAHGGGDFALALLSHAQSNSLANSEKKILTSAEASIEQGAVARRIEIAHELEATKAELEAAKDENRALDTLSREIMARVESSDEKCRALEASAGEAGEAARKAVERQADFDAILESLLDEQERGLKPKQLEYLRGILLCFLKGATQPALRKQLLPVITNVLKFDPQDPRTKEMMSLANHDS